MKLVIALLEIEIGMKREAKLKTESVGKKLKSMMGKKEQDKEDDGPDEI